MQVEFISKEDFESFKEQVIEEIRSALSENSEPKDVYMRAKEVRKMLKISTGNLHALRVKGNIPFYRIGEATYLYKLSDIKDFMERNRIDYAQDNIDTL